MNKKILEKSWLLLTGKIAPTIIDYVQGVSFARHLLWFYCHKFISLHKTYPNQLYLNTGHSIVFEKNSILFRKLADEISDFGILNEILSLIKGEDAPTSPNSLEIIEKNFLLLNDTLPTYIFRNLIKKLPTDSQCRLLPLLNQLIMEGRNDLIDVINNHVIESQHVSLLERKQLLEWKVAYSENQENARNLLRKLIQPNYSNVDREIKRPPLRLRIAIFGRKISPKYISSATTYINWIIKLSNYEIDTIILSDGKPEDSDDLFRQKFTEWHQINHLSDLQALDLFQNLNINLVLKIDSTRSFLNFNQIKIPIIDNGSLVDLSSGSTHAICHHLQLNSSFSQFYVKNKIVTNKFWVHTLDKLPDVPYKPTTSQDFCIFNRATKLSDFSYLVISHLLKKYPNSNLAFKFIQASPHNHIHRYLTETVSFYGIDPNRLTILPRTSTNDQLNLYNNYQYCMETFPQSGGLSTFESLWMNKPSVIFIKDDRPWSLNSKIIYDWLRITHKPVSSLQEYIEQVPLLLQSNIANTRQNIIESKLFDHDGFARNFSLTCYEILGISKPKPDDFSLC